MKTLCRRIGARAVALFAVCAVWLSTNAVTLGATDVSGPLRLAMESAGFAQGVRADKWAPVRFTVENSGPETDVLIEAACDNSGESTHATLRLPARAARRHTLYVNIERGDRLTLKVTDPKSGSMVQRVVNYTCHAPRDITILGLSDGGTGFNCRQVEGALRQTVARLLFNNSASFADLPGRWAGLAPVDVVILGSPPPGGLTVAQEHALVDWVRAGGFLILCPDARAGYAGTLIDAISPAQPLGYRLVDTLPPLAQRYGEIPRVKERIGLSELLARDGTASLAMDGLPLVVSRPEGAGTVAYVAFDLSAERLTEWRGLVEFYRDLIERRGALPKASDTRLAAEAAKTLNEAVGVPVLPRWALGACLAVNLGVVGGCFLLFRRRRVHGFLAAVVAAPVMALLVNLVGGLTSGVSETSLTGLHVVRSNSGAGACSGNGYYVLLSPAEARCEVRFPGLPSAFPKGLTAWAATRDVRRRSAESVREAVPFRDDDLKLLRGLHVRPREPMMFQTEYVTALPGAVEAAATAGADGIRFRVRNRSGARLTSAWVVCNRNAAPLGDLDPGQTATALLDSASARGLMTGFAGTAFRSRTEVRRESVLRAVYASQRGADLFDTGATVFAWLDEQPVAVEVVGLNRPPKSAAQTLWAVRADRAAGHGRLLLPKGVLPLQIRDMDKALIVDGAWRPIGRSTTMEALFTLPPEAQGLQAERIEFFLRLSVATPVSIEARNAETGDYDPILSGSRTAATPVRADRAQFTLPTPEKYLSKADGTVAFRVRVQPPAAPASNLNAGAAARLPVIEEFDLEIKGTRE